MRTDCLYDARADSFWMINKRNVLTAKYLAAKNAKFKTENQHAHNV